MTGHQRLALSLLRDAKEERGGYGWIDTHQMRLKMTIASGGKREWSYSQTHSMMSRLQQGGFVLRHKPSDGSVARWFITDLGLSRLEGLL